MKWNEKWNTLPCESKVIELKRLTNWISEMFKWKNIFKSYTTNFIFKTKFKSIRLSWFFHCIDVVCCNWLVGLKINCLTCSKKNCLFGKKKKKKKKKSGAFIELWFKNRTKGVIGKNWKWQTWRGWHWNPSEPMIISIITNKAKFQTQTFQKILFTFICSYYYYYSSITIN